jgi:hypothetical protein
MNWVDGIRSWLYITSVLEVVNSAALVFISSTAGYDTAGQKLMTIYDVKQNHKKFTGQHVRCWIMWLLNVALIRYLAANIGYTALSSELASVVRHVNVVAHLLEAIWFTIEIVGGFQERKKTDGEKYQKLTFGQYLGQLGVGFLFYAVWVNVVVYVGSDYVLSS